MKALRLACVPLVMALSACSARVPSAPISGEARAVPTHGVPLQGDPFAPPTSALTRTDEQGAVMVAVTPQDFSLTSDQVIFEVALNTHSVDLSMDLATLAVLNTETGAIVKATGWDGPAGGHHVRGRLTFPAMQGGKSILDGAGKLTLSLMSVDAPERTFEWDLPLGTP